jgi:hypothetical protein
LKNGSKHHRYYRRQHHHNKERCRQCWSGHPAKARNRWDNLPHWNWMLRVKIVANCLTRCSSWETCCFLSVSRIQFSLLLTTWLDEFLLKVGPNLLCDRSQAANVGQWKPGKRSFSMVHGAFQYRHVTCMQESKSSHVGATLSCHRATVANEFDGAG